MEMRVKTTHSHFEWYQVRVKRASEFRIGLFVDDPVERFSDLLANCFEFWP